MLCDVELDVCEDATTKQRQQLDSILEVSDTDSTADLQEIGDSASSVSF